MTDNNQSPRPLAENKIFIDTEKRDQGRVHWSHTAEQLASMEYAHAQYERLDKRRLRNALAARTGDALAHMTDYTPDIDGTNIWYAGMLCRNMHATPNERGGWNTTSLRTARDHSCILCEKWTGPFLFVTQPYRTDHRRKWNPAKLYGAHYRRQNFGHKRGRIGPDGLILMPDPSLVGMYKALFKRNDIIRFYSKHTPPTPAEEKLVRDLERGYSTEYCTRTRMRRVGCISKIPTDENAT